MDLIGWSVRKMSIRLINKTFLNIIQRLAIDNVSEITNHAIQVYHKRTWPHVSCCRKIQRWHLVVCRSIKIKLNICKF